MKKTLAYGFLVACLAGLCVAQDRPARNMRLRGETTSAAAREVLEIKRQYDEAQLKNDSAWFERMLAEDYLMVLPDGSMLTKARAVEELRSREITGESATGEEMRVRVYGDTAVVTGRFIGRGRYKGKPMNEHQRFTSVWVKRNGQWQAIAEHATNMAAPSKEP